MSEETAPRFDLTAAIREWRSALIDVGGNNRLLYHRPAAATLDLTDAKPAAVEKLLSGQVVRLTEFFETPQERESARRAISALARKEREAQEEFGVSIAFLAAGLATWDPTANDAILAAEADDLQVDEAQFKRATQPRPLSPVLLRPVMIEKRRGTSESWELRLGDEFQLNGVFQHVINADRERLTEDDLGELSGGTRDEISESLDYVGSKCVDVPGFVIDETLFLGAFSYLKQPMVNDVDNLGSDSASALVLALAGDPTAIELVRSHNDGTTPADPDFKPVDSEFLVLDADASQSYVINAAIAGRNLVVEGPPGTGKSQTIANLIAALVAAEKRVLFVAQKRAAVEAVLVRLRSVELGHTVLDMFAATESRRFVAEQLREAMERQRTTPSPDVSRLHSQLSIARDKLALHALETSRAAHAWGISINDLRTRLAGISPLDRSDFRLHASTFTTWTPAQVFELGAALGDLASLGALDATWGHARGWNPSLLTTTEAAQVYASNATYISSLAVPEFIADSRTLASAGGWRPPETLEEARGLVSLADRARSLRSRAANLVEPAVSIDDLRHMRAAIDRRYRREYGQSRTRQERQADKARLDALTHDLQLSRRGTRQLVAEALWLCETFQHGSPESWGQAADRYGERYRDIVARLTAMQPAVVAIDLLALPLENLVAVAGSLARDPAKSKMPRAFGIERLLTDAGLSPLLAHIREQSRNGVQWARDPAKFLEWVVLSSILEAAVAQSPHVAGVEGAELHRAAEEFRAYDGAHLEANAARVRRRAAEHLTRVLNEFPEQHVALKTELSRKRNFRSVRKLLQIAPNAILAAKPVWAMSPLQVSRILPAAECFDVVIFDEASQVRPADAVPSLLRAGQAIIAGDSRQLPPTDFFGKVLEDVPALSEVEVDQKAADDETAEIDTSDNPPAVQTVRRETLTRDAESILAAFDRVLAGQSRRLQWHYRSQDERLIAVSNAGVYDFSLTTFPTPDYGEGLRFEKVPPSRGIGKTAKSPEAEVLRVVDLVAEHARERPDESLGVIAFGVAHQRRIERALDERLLADEQLREFVEAHPREKFFIKSIERVQGDERDAIILTVGYGKSDDGKLRLFWGPLLQDGGERRLNVAISRAKKRLTLVASFGPDDLAADAHHSAGYRLMYAFVRFVASGGTELTNQLSMTAPLNPFEIDVRDKLVAAGLALDSQYGVGAYKIDFAVRHPEQPGTHVLAIEADGAAYHSGQTARDRDRLRQTLLESRGWVFCRIWSTDWFNDADAEITRVLQAYERALQGDSFAGASEPQTDSEAYWDLTEAVHTRPKPYVFKGLPITEYSRHELAELIRSYRAGGLLHAEEEELDWLVKELGFARRGQRIIAAIQDAQAYVDSLGRP